MTKTDGILKYFNKIDKGTMEEDDDPVIVEEKLKEDKTEERPKKDKMKTSKEEKEKVEEKQEVEEKLEAVENQDVEEEEEIPFNVFVRLTEKTFDQTLPFKLLDFNQGAENLVWLAEQKEELLLRSESGSFKLVDYYIFHDDETFQPTSLHHISKFATSEMDGIHLIGILCTCETPVDDPVPIARIHMPLGQWGVYWLSDPVVYVTCPLTAELDPDRIDEENVYIDLVSPCADYRAVETKSGFKEFNDFINWTSALIDFVENPNNLITNLEDELRKVKESEDPKYEGEGDESSVGTDDYESGASLNERLMAQSTTLEAIRDNEDFKKFLKLQVVNESEDLKDVKRHPLTKQLLNIEETDPSYVTSAAEVSYQDEEEEESDEETENINKDKSVKRKRSHKGTRRSENKTRSRRAQPAKKVKMNLQKGPETMPITAAVLKDKTPELLGAMDMEKVKTFPTFKRPQLKEFGKLKSFTPDSKRIRTGMGYLAKTGTLLFENGTEEVLTSGDFVLYRDRKEDSEEYLMKITKIIQPLEDGRRPRIHGCVCKFSTNSYFGDVTVFPNWLFYTDEHRTASPFDIFAKPRLDQIEIMDAYDFEKLIGDSDSQLLPNVSRYEDKFWIYCKHLHSEDRLRFEHLDTDTINFLRSSTISQCPCCVVQTTQENNDKKYDKANPTKTTVKGIELSVGDFCYLSPTALTLFDAIQNQHVALKERETNCEHLLKQAPYNNADLYPELVHYARKNQKREKPVEVLQIVKILELIPNEKSTRVAKIRVQQFYRTTDLDFGTKEDYYLRRGFPEVFLPLNEGKTVKSVGMDKWEDIFERKCVVRYAKSTNDVGCFSGLGIDEFLCSKKCYKDKSTGKYEFQSLDADQIGMFNKLVANSDKKVPSVPELELDALELFCGAGGSACGLERAGIRTKIAVEMNVDAAKTLEHNIPGCDIKKMDVNIFLRECKANTEGFPQRGDLDVIFGGPPCQGFSRMNRYSYTDSSKGKNTCVATQLAICEFLRTRFTGMENVLAMKDYVDGISKNSLLKAIIQIQLLQNYQVSVYVANAGAYGAPQNRTRTIIIGAHYGEKLPETPQPTHSCQNPAIIIPGWKKDETGGAFYGSMPELMVCDAIADLPSTKAGQPLSTTDYTGAPKTFYQLQMRSGLEEVKNHESRRLQSYELERIKCIPSPTDEIPYPDWRFIPNVYKKLMDGTKLQKMIYAHCDEARVDDPRLKKSGCLRMYCEDCDAVKAGKMKSHPKRIQNEGNISLVPICLAHSSDRHRWDGCYGRLNYFRGFGTITCGDSLVQHTGRIVHPEQDRRITVREMARGQTFPDTWIFVGNKLDSQITQVGNAVPPNLAHAIGQKIKAAADLKKVTE